MAKEERNTVIHIGMPKAASTSLQQSFLIRLPLINYSGVRGRNISSRDSLKRVLYNKETDYNAGEVQQGIEGGFTKQLPLVISNENVSNPILQQFKKIPQEREVIANRFKKLYPNAKILIVIRNQFSIHKSMYVQKLKGERDSIPIKKITYNKWLNWNRELNENGLDNVFRFADYYSLISTYKNLFKEIKVVVFEEMIKDMQGFLYNELCPFIGVDRDDAIQYYNNKVKNKRRSKNSIFVENIIRVILNFMRFNLGNPQKVISKDSRKSLMRKIHKITHLIPFGKVDTTYSVEQKRFIESYYAESNKKVSDIIGVDLEKYGYPVLKSKK